MANPSLQINMSSKAGRMLRHAVRLLNADRQALFVWRGPAFSASDAQARARVSYQMVCHGICAIHGLKVSTLPAEFHPVDFEVTQSRGPEEWRVWSWLPSTCARRACLIRPAMRTPYKAGELIRAVIYADRECVRTIASGGEIGAILSVNVPHYGDAYAIETEIVTPCNGKDRRLRLAKPALADALKLIALHLHDCRSVPFRKARYEVRPRILTEVFQSATLRAAVKARGIRTPLLLIDWLKARGYGPLADSISASFADDVGSARDRDVAVQTATATA